MKAVSNKPRVLLSSWSVLYCSRGPCTEAVAPVLAAGKLEKRENNELTFMLRSWLNVDCKHVPISL